MTTRGVHMARFAGAVLALVLVAQGPSVGLAQTTPPGQSAAPPRPAVTGPTAATDAAVVTGPDYAAWDGVADAAETAVADPGVASERLEAIRADLVTRRGEFQAAQNINAARIATLQEQMGALGAAPAEGQTEAPEIAERRATLKDQLDQLQVPGLTASEAFRRADGIIREIDRIQRERQASDLIQLWPSPLNPANWPAGMETVRGNLQAARNEVAVAVAREDSRSDLAARLPTVLGLTLVGLGLILRGGAVMAALAAWLSTRIGARWLKVALPLVSFGRFVLPILGLFLLVAGIQHTGLTGPQGLAAIGGLAWAGLAALTANWLGYSIFAPGSASAPQLMRLGPGRLAEGRWLTTMLGLTIGLETFRSVVYKPTTGSAAASVLAFPILVLAGVLLVRMGMLLRRHLANVEAAGDSPRFVDRVQGLLGRIAIVLGCVGPMLAAVGYVPAALGLLYPAAVSLGVVAVVYILQTLVEDLYDALTGRSEPDGGALVPVLIGFVLALCAVPVLALVWGARPEDLTELWSAFTRGFSIGETQIAPSDFAVFAAIFAIGFMATRLLQSALRATVLPRTRLDQGGQKAVISGVGYLGVFIAGLVAVQAAGINLAGLAIVAGALSLGVGFGLKNIVENFVSGIILLVERPVSEGDWIEVGGVQGTVQAISVRSTRIQTFDRSDVIVPNADLVSGRVTNFTRFNLSGRLIVPVSVAHDSDTRKVERVLREIVEAEPMALVNPMPMVVLMDFGADAINFEVRMILSDVNFSLSVRSEMNHEIVRRFREEGIEIPFPQREVWVHPDSAGVPAPVPRPPRSRPPRAALVRAEATQRSDLSDHDAEANNR